MSIDIFGQYLINGLMLGMIYAMVAVGFTLFFGVMEAIQFAHGDVLMLGAFTALIAYLGLDAIGILNPWVQIFIMLACAIVVTATIGALVAKYLALPLKNAPSLNMLLVTLMLGLVIRESVRLFYPDGSNSKPFPRLLPDNILDMGVFSIRADNFILLITGLLSIVVLHLVITRTKLGLSIRAVAQDSETAQIMGINFQKIVLLTFGIGSAMAAIAGVMNGLYYSEINFGVGLLLGIIGFSAAILGGLTNVYGAILGGFLFAALQTIGAVVLPMISTSFPSAYKDVFAFAVVIILLAWKPSGLIAERSSERV